MDKSLDRIILGIKFTELAEKLESFDEKPYAKWTRQDKETEAEILEQQTVLDIELDEYLIKDGDAYGIYQHNMNKEFVANYLWMIKRDLAIA